MSISENSSYPNIDATKKEFSHLDASQKKMLVNDLNQSQRQLLINIINNTAGQTGVPLEKTHALREKILQFKKETPDMVGSSELRGPFASIYKKISKILDNLAVYFNVFTTNKTIEVINRSLNKTEAKNSIDEEKLMDLVGQAKVKNPHQTLKLATILKENGFSLDIAHLSFANTSPFKGLDLEGIIFNDCTFDWSSFGGTKMKDVVFQNCTLSNASFMNAKMDHCAFLNCEMRETMFTGAKVESVLFRSSSLTCNSFEDASLKNCNFESLTLTGTHFLEASIAQCKISECNLQDTVFFGNKPKFEIDDYSKNTAKMTRPAAAISVNPEARGITNPKAIIKLGTTAHVIPLRVTMQPQKTQKDAVNKEMEKLLKAIGPSGTEKPPIAQRLVKEILAHPDENPQCFSILKKAQQLSREVDGFFLPGGEDIPPALYGHEASKETNWGGDYRRSIFEIGMIDQSFHKGIPLMGICRGFQMSNVYFGAELTQHIEGQHGIQRLQVNPQLKSGLIKDVLKSSPLGVAIHHQGILENQKAKEHLETVSSYDGIVKAVQPKAGGASPMILLQIHPEYLKTSTADTLLNKLLDAAISLFISDQNEKFWEVFSDSTKAYQSKKIALDELKKNIKPR